MLERRTYYPNHVEPILTVPSISTWLVLLVFILCVAPTSRSLAFVSHLYQMPTTLT